MSDDIEAIEKKLPNVKEYNIFAILMLAVDSLKRDVMEGRKL